MRIPGVPYVQGRNSYSDTDGMHYGIAIHNTSNNASDENEASFATRRTDGTSAHFYVDRDSVTQSLDTNARSGHAGSSHGNNNAISFELTGGNATTRAQWLANIDWPELGRVIAYILTHDPDYKGFQVRRASVAEMKSNPKVKAFYGHDDMRRAWGGTTHTDPGGTFPWDRLFSAVNAALKPPAPPKPEVKDMLQTEVLTADTGMVGRTAGQLAGDLANLRGYFITKVGDPRLITVPEAGSPLDLLVTMAQEYGQLRALLTQFINGELVNERLIAAEVVAQLGGPGVDLDTAAAALRAAFGDRAAELGALLTT